MPALAHVHEVEHAVLQDAVPQAAGRIDEDDDPTFTTMMAIAPSGTPPSTIRCRAGGVKTRWPSRRATTAPTIDAARVRAADDPDAARCHGAVSGLGTSGPDPREAALSSAQPSFTGIEAVRGQGAWIEGADGRAYLDLAAGIATCNLGHSHPAVIAAVLARMERVIPPGGVCGHARSATSRRGSRRSPRRESTASSTTGSEANEVAL